MATPPTQWERQNSTTLPIGCIEFNDPHFLERPAYVAPQPQQVFMVGPARFMTIDAFAAISGYTSSAIRSKKAEGIWREGKEYVIAPDGRILVDVEGYNKWVQGRQ